jgi:hypothetical protein
MPVTTVQLSAADIKACDEAIRTLERVLGHYKSQFAAIQHAASEDIPARQQSYVQLAIAVLEEIGKPTPITVLLERIRERRNDPTITRGSVETSLLRHLNLKGDNTEVIKPSPGTYALRQHVTFQYCG